MIASHNQRQSLFCMSFQSSLLCLPLLSTMPFQTALFVCIEFETLAHNAQLTSYQACCLSGFRCYGYNAFASGIVGFFMPCGFMLLSVFSIPTTILEANVPVNSQSLRLKQICIFLCWILVHCNISSFIFCDIL